MGSPLTKVVQNYGALGAFLIERWSDHASAVAAKLDARDYGADCAVADLAKCAYLATESGFLLASEAFDSAAMLTGCRHERNIVHSGPLFTSLKGATLTLAGPLTTPQGDMLPLSRTWLEPPALGPGETEFKLRADATGCRGAAYTGFVDASTPGVPVESVFVFIVVP